jgi:CPA2 family monovalent cation:H+ antiporter-2
MQIEHTLLIVFAVATSIVLLFHRLRQPPIVGFILSGVLIGPYGLAVVSDPGQVSGLAEIGLVLLLFTLGTEFSLAKIRREGLSLLLMGLSQCVLSTLFIFGILHLLGLGWLEALAFGSVASVSSTAIVLKLLQDRKESRSPVGRASTAILLFQDIWVVPLLVFLPLLASSETASEVGAGSFYQALAKIGILALVVLIAAKVIVPLGLRLVVRTNYRELFVSSVLLLALGLAVLSHDLGLSYALGAFIAGVLLAESDYAHQAVAEIASLRDPLMALFFISVGMLLNLDFFLEHVVLVSFLAVLVFAGKYLSIALSVRALGYDSRFAALVGLYLAQVGEFGFVLITTVRQAGLVSAERADAAISVTLLLMLFTPMAVRYAPRLAPALGRLDPISRILRARVPKGAMAEVQGLHGHVVIIGLGENGLSTALVCKQVGIPVRAVEINQEAVHRAKQQGIDAHYGDASAQPVLEATAVAHARAVVVAINDAAATRRVVLAVRSMRADVPIIVRLHFSAELERFAEDMDVELVIGEIESGVELVARVLRLHAVPDTAIASAVSSIAADRYRSLRQFVPGGMEISALRDWLSVFSLESVTLSESSPLAQRTLEEIQLRAKTGALVVAVIDEHSALSIPGPGHVLGAGETLYIAGPRAAVSKARALIEGIE